MTLDIGCGAGRNLTALNLNSIGIDHNAILVESCKLRGLQAYSTDDFLKNGSKYIACFDSILISHVAEHMSLNDFVVLLKEYKSFLKPAGVVVVICPQELGYASDSTHINFMDFKELEKALKASGFEVLSQYSYPFPRFFGKWFTQNEFVVNAKLT